MSMLFISFHSYVLRINSQYNRGNNAVKLCIHNYGVDRTQFHKDLRLYFRKNSNTPDILFFTGMKIEIRTIFPWQRASFKTVTGKRLKI